MEFGRTSNSAALLLGVLLLLGVCGKTWAQTIPHVGTSGAQTSQNSDSASKRAVDRKADLRALDRVLKLLKDDQARATLVKDLERLRSGVAAKTEVLKDARAKNKGDEGLLGAVTEAVITAGEKAPEALAAPLDHKINQATDQVQRQFGDAYESGSMQRFLLTAAPGWLLAIGLALGVRILPWVRRGREKLMSAVRESADSKDVLRAILIYGIWSLAPLLIGAAVVALWPRIGDLSDTWARIFLAAATPILVGALVWQFTSGLLSLLGPSRGWRRIGYAQRRLVPWISGLSAAVSASAILRSPYIWGTLSADVADVAALALDVGIGCLIIVFIAKYRLLVRSLIVRRHTASASPKDASPLWRVISILAKNWHVLGVLFVVAHLAARLLGGNVDFFISSVLSLLVIIIGLMVALWVDARLANSARRRKRNHPSVMRRIGARYLQIARLYAQAALLLLVTFICLKIWGLNPGAWLDTEIAWTIVRPVLSIVAALTAGWMLWIALDSSIENALSSVDRYGRTRAHSSRTKTVLPLVRNIIFISLCAIIIIAVLANLGINVAPLLAGAGIVGLAVGFGSQQLVQDLITGLFILFEGTIAVGDFIDTGDRSGVVEALTIRTVRIRDADGALHSVPFSQITALKNRSRDYGVYTVKVAVGYGSDLDQAMAIMREIGEELQSDPKFSWEILAPLEILGVDQFSPEGVVIMGAIKTRPLKQWSVGRELNLRLKKRFDAAGISMAVQRLSLVTPAFQDGEMDKRPPVTQKSSAG
jgi:small conductance mechanosensitive channel